jgi:hypothetical protein
MRYFVEEQGDPRGPYTLGQLRSMWTTGTLTGETRYRPEGSAKWVPLRFMADELEEREPQGPAKAVATLTKPLDAKSSLRGCLVAMLVLAVIGLGLASMGGAGRLPGSKSVEEQTREEFPAYGGPPYQTIEERRAWVREQCDMVERAGKLYQTTRLAEINAELEQLRGEPQTRRVVDRRAELAHERDWLTK